MAKKKTIGDTPNPFRKEREEYDRRMAEMSRKQEEERRSGSGPATVCEIKIPRKIPGREIEIDWSKFTEARRQLIDQAVVGQVKWPLYVYGEVGVGKTFLAAAVYSNWRSPQPLWMPYTQFCDRCERLRDGRGISVPKNAFESREISSFEEWWKYIATFSLIVIDDFGILDDLGTGNVSSDLLHARRYRNEWMIELLDQRLRKPVFLTGNLAVENSSHNNRLKSIYEVFDQRLINRLKAGRALEIYGKDLRTESYTIEAIE